MLKNLVIINIFIVIVLFLVGATKSNTFVIKDVLIEGPDDYGLSLSIDASGKVYVLGDSNNGRKSVVYISRFNSDGSVDRTFGSEGKVVFKNIAGGSWDKTYLSCLHVKEDKIYVSGESMNSNSDYDAFVIKLNSNGSLDSTFANGGILVLNNLAGGQWDDFGRAIYFHEKIYLAGKSWNAQGENAHTDVFVVRINNDGSIDKSFGKDGKVILNSVAGGDWDDDVFALQVDSKCKVYIGGTSWNGRGGNSGIDGYVIRLNSAGSLDESFGKRGSVILKNIIPNSL
ncbi:MAG: delta-60 repeat domain-containing protein, partial [Candidatus Calescibacterium sp.]|nr:delta-60 repeat domain-containing protein [Candidatus Calescibacterium sp.]